VPLLLELLVSEELVAVVVDVVLEAPSVDEDPPEDFAASPALVDARLSVR
jgi:hypothetical protein